MQATSLFGQAEGIRRKVAGQTRIEGRIHNYTFLHTMRRMAVNLAVRKEPGQDHSDDSLVGFVNSDDLRKWAEREGIEPDHPNAWGAIFRKAPTGYRFEKTPEWRASRIPSNHGREVPTWAVFREVA